ncbi:MAG TPA: sigma 54-interacting transcriptional regulator [Kiritimatiellia bacterium]|nr:sigma 54-interacting transcriptional regulator [Kiritimatiellia bacterium]
MNTMKPSDASEPLPLIHALLEGTSGETGLPFFRALVDGLTKALGTHGAWVTEYLEPGGRLRSIAFRLGDEWVENYDYDVRDTPCGTALEKRDVVFFPDRILDLYPGENDLRSLKAVSYIGAPLLDESGTRILGHVGVLDQKPMPEAESFIQIFRIFVNRAGAELRRLNLERALRARTEELDAVVQSAMDAILILNGEHDIVRANKAAESIFGTRELVGKLVDHFLSVAGAQKLEPLLHAAAAAGEARQWIPGGFDARRADARGFAAEGTLSRFELAGRMYFTLILRDVQDRIEAERRLAELDGQRAYLQEEVEHHFGEIVGESAPMQKVLQDIRAVAATEASVLITGETGTGKELVARAVHRASRRAEKPLIKVNCAAIPANLIESEFFGHEKGAFTGATSRREGRFALADGGTIFLDELGELPLDLQAKLLRVLQEGEFEPVGSARTRKVDVRVIAATNRDLRGESEAGRFREDLYYRISVFPIHVPALRHRGNDIDLLAHAFLRRFAERDGRKAPELTSAQRDRLRAYAWPGNVRELANVIERALITGGGKHLQLDVALPAAVAPNPEAVVAVDDDRVWSAAELAEREAANMKRALARTGGKISGPDGAAALLGLKPTTLRSRLKALGLS